MIKMHTLASTEEWLEHRLGGIGGSEISAIVGLNPYMSNVELWERKTGRVEAEDISSKPYVEYGHAAEPLLRELFKLDYPQLTVEYVENNSFSNDRFPWALASLDGWSKDQDGRRGILEIKTTNIMQSQQKEKWNDDHIPQNYYCQCLLYMAVLEAEYCDLTAQLKWAFGGNVYKQIKNYHFERSEVQEDIDYIMDAGERFWEFVVEDKRPPLVLPEI